MYQVCQSVPGRLEEHGAAWLIAFLLAARGRESVPHNVGIGWDALQGAELLGHQLAGWCGLGVSCFPWHGFAKTEYRDLRDKALAM